MSWLVDAAELLERGDPGPTPWLVDGLIADKALTAIVGRWKTTKSYGMLDIAISIATGRPAFGRFAIPEPGPVVFVNEESGEAALWRRLDALCRGRAIRVDELRGRLWVAANKGVKLDAKDWQTKIIEEGRLRPRLFIFDPLARMKAPGRNESAQNEISFAIEFMRRLRDETGAGVAFVHHTGHQGEHMRGSSDLESAWESRLSWKRDGQAAEVTIEAEHREAEPSAPFSYRISWDALTRSMRFEPVEAELAARVREHLLEYPDASANAVFKAIGGNRDRVLQLVKELREQVVPELGYHPGTTPRRPEAGGGTPDPPFRGSGTTPADPPSGVVPHGGYRS
ncbi:MAG TPA: AAA family ATPase [Gaiellaceae bacterium]|nr:AAA family ATPase [Gaiellaceae bacterium]